MLSKKISLNKVVAGLSDDTSRLLFTWAIAHQDREGRIHGDPDVFRSIVAPRLPHITAQVCEKYIEEWAAAELIIWYECDGDKFIAFPKFADNNRGLHTEREAPSDIPDPASDRCRTVTGKGPRNVMECNGKECKAAPVPKEPKKEFSKGVTFTDSEYAKLCEKYGKAVVDAGAEILSAYKEAHGKTYKSDAGAMREWAAREAIKRGAKAGPKKLDIRKCPNGHDYLAGTTCRTCGWKEGESDG